jgi:Mrp family chromosome partitioning ATPase
MVALGVAVAQHEKWFRRTILVELDFGSPALSDRLELAATPGLTEVLLGTASLDEAIQWLSADFGVLVAGAHWGGASPWPAIAEILVELQKRSDVTVVDLPPLSLDAGEATDLCATVLLVVRAAATSLDEIRGAAALLKQEPLVILNAVSSPVPRWLDNVFRARR